MKNRRKENSYTVIGTWIIVGFVILATVGGIIGVAFNASNSQNSNFTATTVPPITASDWSQGNANAKVTLIEYGDFQCPACAAYKPILKQVIAAYGDRIQFVFRNFPLYQVHEDADLAAKTAEAAGLQGKYWEMFDMLYDKQTTWSLLPLGLGVKSAYESYASSLGLDVKKLDADIDSAQVKQKIQTDVDGGNAAQIDHTPTFFVNLKQIPNPTSYDQFKSVIDAALAQ